MPAIKRNVELTVPRAMSACAIAMEHRMTLTPRGRPPPGPRPRPGACLVAPLYTRHIVILVLFMLCVASHVNTGDTFASAGTAVAEVEAHRMLFDLVRLATAEPSHAVAWHLKCGL